MNALVAAGLRVLVPDLRGAGDTHFTHSETVRDGTAVALAQDVVDLADGLGLDRFAVVGHDWGARAAYTLAALWPEITLNAYRSRFHTAEPVDPRYDALRVRLDAIDHLTVPTLLIQGYADLCDRPSESAGLEHHFDT